MGKLKQYHSGAWEVRAQGSGTGGSGSSTFLGLTDTPSAFTGQAGKVAAVNTGETALEFATPSGGTSFDTNFFATMSGNQNITKLTETKVTFDTVVTDANSEWDAVNTKWVCAEDGTYLVTAVGSYVANSSGMRGLFAYVDGVKHVYIFGYAWNNGTVTTRPQFAFPIELVTGNYLEVYTYHSSTTTPLELTALGSSWSVHRIH